jgi:hypothetical protein
VFAGLLWPAPLTAEELGDIAGIDRGISDVAAGVCAATMPAGLPGKSAAARVPFWEPQPAEVIKVTQTNTHIRVVIRSDVCQHSARRGSLAGAIVRPLGARLESVSIRPVELVRQRLEIPNAPS